jgi:hypothetical protein
VIRSLATSHGLDDIPVANLAGITMRISESGQTVGERIALLDGQTVAVTRNEEL